MLKNLTVLGAMVMVSFAAAADKGEANSVLDFEAKSIQGKEVDLSQYKGKVLLVVNVASDCGLTEQYIQLEALHEKYSEQGLAVLGFPCNQFGGQEPNSEAKIAEFCKAKYDVKFDLFSKTNVNGADASDLYKHLTSIDAEPVGKGKISWNFEKFVVGREGNVVARFSPRTLPDDPAVIQVIEAELAKK